MFGEKVRELRQALGIDLKTLCMSTGLDYYVMSKAENGYAKPSVSKGSDPNVALEALCIQLGDAVGILKDMYHIDRGEIPPDLDKVKILEKIIELRRVKHGA
jgi:transcriptional regulator with XRE-family HTH domain